ncbi:MAG: type I-U CRISPR-associated helicase/endonuclease Cas3 [Planctomycetes bacterium]|nr:type I-U CRISPR-associated helicase/endonuclease Cas3 [Planctomycetota bacterium]
MNDVEFQNVFHRLTYHRPLSWQTRLFRDISSGEVPGIIDLPTGLGKTMVMAIWLIARMKQPDKIPTRLIYVVDRRTVVDQATDLATKLRDNCHQSLGIDPPAISTLRGQLADNRQWSQDISRPAIIIGTVDLIGSALLFSGYRSSYRRRPLEAGLLGQDSLLVLDEAHLSKPFEKLLGAMDRFNECRANASPVKPMRLIRMSATGGNSIAPKPPFALQFDAHGNLTNEDAKDETVVERFGAKKRLTVTTLGEKEKLIDKLANAAIELARHPEAIGKRIAVFVKKPKDARAVARLIREHARKRVDETGSKPKIVKSTPYADSVEVLTGTMRGLERDKLVEKPVFKDRWLHGDLQPDDPANQSPIFLISTSAGEVGFDLNADHLVGDEAPLDSWIQRLGRVNRRGMGTAVVQLFVELSTKKTNESGAEQHSFASASSNAIDVLQRLQEAERLDTDQRPETIFDASPRALHNLAKPGNALSPTPTTVELTDILLDAWSMTSITDRMPGRPEVGPWLRGIDDQLPQTSIAWRAELELLKHHPDATAALQRIFAKHPIRPHETISTNSYRIVEFLSQACKLKDRPDNLPKMRVAIRLSRGKIILRTIEALAKDPDILFAEPTLIFPATFGGLDATGMLDAEGILKAPKADDPPTRSLDVADHPGYEQRDDASPRLRLLIRRADDRQWIAESMPGVAISERLQLEATYSTSTQLFADLRKNDLRIRLVQPIELDDEGDAVRSLVMLSPISKKNKPEDQSLNDHVGAVECEARRIADALRLEANDPVRIALLFAARWHDEGKKADIWQRFVYGDAANYKGKSSKTRDPKSLLGYRHEFGSLLRIQHPDRCGTTGCVLPTDPDAHELALHLIATHHGMGRPHFPSAVYRDFNDSERDVVHTDSIRRFARLQRKYGWWYLAWLENLLRSADALGSADQDAEDDPTNSEGGAA